jgi:transcriptional regulator with XRE-family HTH domain
MRLAEARRRAGLTQVALERFAALPAGIIAEIETGSRLLGPADHALASRIAGTLTIELRLVDELIGAHVDRPPASPPAS